MSESVTRWCFVHNQPAGPRAYAYCWDIDAEDFPNTEFVAAEKERAGCDIRNARVVEIIEEVDE